MAEEPQGVFAAQLRERRTRLRLTQQELAGTAGLSLRTVSDLERGAATTPQKETVRLLADALGLIGPEREEFETAARGRPLAAAPQAAAASAAAVRSLPRDVTSFIGRQRELEQLMTAASAPRGIVGIHAIGGMAGVGKTAFAVHVAHQLAGRFPGGQVFLPLHGHTPGQHPVDPADALASLLLAIGVPAARVPPGLEVRAALWRDRVAGRRLLLVLDDAASSEQVAPLLPGAGSSLVIVTSRRHLSALYDATSVSLDTMPPGDAAALLVRLAGRAGLGPDDAGVREIIGLCGHLPLAIGMVGRQLRHHPAWTAAGRAAELASARDRLHLMETENLSVAAAFDLSYVNLTKNQQRLFRRLGLHPGDDIDAYATAALDGTGLAAARRGLDDLYDHYLLTEPAQGRYRLHDLVREHARTLAAGLDRHDRDAATARLLDYYQHTAAAANVRITRSTRPGPAADGAAPAVVPTLTDLEQALAWARAERASLLACLDYASGTGQHARVIALTAGLSYLWQQDGPWVDAAARHIAAVQAARDLGDRLGQANALVDLASIRRLTSDYPAAAQALEYALGLYRDLCDRLGQANALSGLGVVQRMATDYPAAAQTLEEALGLYGELSDRRGQATALAHLGAVRVQTGDYPNAVQDLEQALEVCRDIGDQVGQANALTRLGLVRQLTGDYPAAVQALEQALDVCRQLDARHGQANALFGLARVRRLMGDYPAAALALHEALRLYADLGNRVGQANALGDLAKVRRLTGNYPAAARDLEEARSIYREIGNRSAEGEALNEAGTLYQMRGDIGRARSCHQQALELARETGIAWDEASSLAGLGRCARADEHVAQARIWLRQALEIFQRIGAAEAPVLLAELNDLPGP